MKKIGLLKPRSISLQLPCSGLFMIGCGRAKWGHLGRQGGRHSIDGGHARAIDQSGTHPLDWSEGPRLGNGIHL